MPIQYPPDDPREWLNRAHSNLVLAQTPGEDIYLEDLCFNLQQAAEKAIKGLLIKHGVAFPYVHDIGELLFYSKTLDNLSLKSSARARVLLALLCSLAIPVSLRL